MFTAQGAQMPKKANFAAKVLKIHDIRKQSEEIRLFFLCDSVIVWKVKSAMPAFRG